jgi:hypothetical protein
MIKPLLSGKHYTADISRLDGTLLREMLSAIRSRASSSCLEQVPVVITNHSKYMSDFVDFDRFLGEIAVADDLKTITMTELVQMLRKGMFEIKRQTSPQRRESAKTP